ncbi:MAG: cysteine peptidase family C39 domain-containing protein [Pirellula sp.]|jgi:hypothetical protein
MNSRKAALVFGRFSGEGILRNILFSICLGLIFESSPVAAENFSEKLVDLYEASRLENRVYSWDFVHWQINTKPAVKMSSLGVEESIKAAQDGVDLFALEGDLSAECQGSMIADAQRFNLKIAYKTKWVGGTADRISCKTQRCFDGKVFGSASRSLPGDSFPKDTNSPDENCATVVDIGTFTSEREQMDLELGKSGHCAVMPNFPAPFYAVSGSVEFQRFLDACKMNSEDSVKSWQHKDSGFVHLEVLPPKLKKYEYLFSYRILPNGRVERVDLKTGGLIVKSCVFRYSDSGPQALAAMDWVNGRGYRIAFSNFKELKNVAETTFRVSVPDGAIVNDLDRSIKYTAGVTTKDEVDRLAEYVKSHDLKAVPSQSRRAWYGALVIGAILVFAIFNWIRSKRASGVLGAIALLLISGSTALSADPNIPERSPTWDGMDWKIDLGASEQIRLRQCGFTATTIVLNILHPGFNPREVAKDLEPTKDGVRFNRIKSILEANGLEVTAYKDTNLKRVMSSTRAGDVAIVAVSKLGFNAPHYVVVASDHRGRKLWIDYPFEPSDLASWKTEELDLVSNCVVLICRKIQVEKETLISLHPKHIEIGKSDFSNGIYLGRVRIENEGKTPAVCNFVKKSCSCVSTEHQSSFTIEKGGSLEFAFRLKYEDFVGKAKPARLAFEFANGKVLEFVADVNVQNSEKQVLPRISTRSRIVVNPDQIEMDNRITGLIECGWLSQVDLSDVDYRHPDWMELKLEADKIRIGIVSGSVAMEKFTRYGRISDTLRFVRSSDERVVAEVEFEFIRSND